jgi:diadenosine tetraphosphate (Ap4A) HIT family hydrolase
MNNTPSTCNSCAALAQDNLTLFETTHWKVDLAPNQAYLGRSYVNLRRHAGHLGQLTPPEWAELGRVITRFEEAVTNTFGATCFNWTALMNNAYKSAAPNPHVHLHVWPRYQTAPNVLGKVFEDPNFAHHYDKTATHDVEPELLNEISLVLRKNMGSMGGL